MSRRIARLVAGFSALLCVAGPAWALDAGRIGGERIGGPSLPVETEPAHRTAAVENRDAIAVIIGNRRYANGLPEVLYAENDALAARRLATEVLGYRAGNIIDLRNASQAEMLSVFGNAADHRGKLWAWVKSGVSDVFVYYSGHGVPGLRDKRGYLLPVDADPATPEINGYSLDLLLANLSRLEARSTLVMLDACFSGNSAAGWLLRSASPVYIRTEAPADPTGLSVISAAQGDQVASWDQERRLGLFTRHVMDALFDGAADRGRGGNGDGAVTLGEVETYLDDELSYAARRLYRRVQNASVLGDPKTVLVPDVRRRAPPAPLAQPVLGASPQRTPPAGVPSGRYPALGPSIADAQLFLQTHWDDVRRTIESYYLRQGTVWDQRGNPPQVEFAERMKEISERRVVKVAGNTFDLEIRYRWQGGGVSDIAEAVMRIAVAPDALAVEKMWR
ncbi:caspase family protein [Thalassobaculum litoreum]|uniref:Caspase domain-containing protein n=1 Tax=Thalassobaculum litoreum DSM 18839 TaxID=1123362 RepID=A0A8G2EYL8_9PROT|nr:caspase family protein [Thalassobaculum litoreum]SDF86724.1 Caspase domain-containing protein [Thalassobaculum litoreum DSM 18839]